MKVQEFDLKEVKEYTSILNKKPNVMIPFLILTMLVALLTMLIATFLIDKEYLVTTAGTYSTSEDLILYAPYQGAIKEVRYEDGQSVTAGETIILLDDSSITVSEEELLAEIESNKTKLSYLKLQEESIKEGVNKFDASDSNEIVYYKKVENYFNKLSKGSNVDLTNLEETRDMLYKQVDCINREVNLFDKENESLWYYKVESYLQSLNVYVDTVDGEEEIKKKDSQYKEALKNEKLLECLNEIESIDNEIKTLVEDNNQEINSNAEENYRMKNEELEYIYEEIASTQKTIDDIEVRMKQIELQKAEFIITAPTNGTVNFVQNFKPGMVINTTTPICKVIADNDGKRITTEIPAEYIRKISEGETVKVSFDLLEAYSKKYYTGTIERISADIFMNETDGTSYYQAVINLDQQLDKLKSSTPCEVKIIYDKKKWITYILECLGFKD